MVKIFPLAFVILLASQAQCQNLNHYGLFPTIDHSGTLSNKWSYSLYYFSAFNLVNDKVDNVADNPGYFLFYAEQAISYKLNKKLSVTGSYVYQRQEPLDKQDYVSENRFYFQATYKSPVGKGQLKNRLRYDGRFIEDKTSNTWPFTSRIRYLLGISYPLNEKFYLSAYNEMFFNTYPNPTVVYGENWAYAGIGLHTKSAGSWEFGPLYIFWVANKARDLLNFNYLQVTWITHLDLRKQKN
jgi:Protein of unknown function (DUF2490)